MSSKFKAPKPTTTINLFNPVHVFGFNNNTRENIAYLDEETLLYSAGKHLVLHTPLNQSQRFIAVKDSVSISVVSVCAAHGICAVAVATEKVPFIAIYDLVTLKRKKVMSLPESTTAKNILSMCISLDGKYALCLTGETDW